MISALFCSRILCYTVPVMIKRPVLHFVITLASIIVSTALLLLPEPPAVYVAWLCPVLFFSVLTGICCGFFPALLTGILPPFFAYLVQKFALPGADPSFYVPMAVYAVSGITAAIVYRMLNSSIGASVSAVLAGRFVLGTANLVIYFLRGRTYTFRMFLYDGFLSVFSGLMLVLLIPILILLFRRRGIMKLLRGERTVY